MNLNQAGSINKAITESQNNFFTILNADDALLPYVIPLLHTLLNKYPFVHMLGGSCIPFDKLNVQEYLKVISNIIHYDPLVRLYDWDEVKTIRTLNHLYMTMSGCSFSKKAWEAVDGFWSFDKRICSWDDRDFQLRVSCLARVAVFGEPTALYRLTSSTGKAQQ